MPGLNPVKTAQGANYEANDQEAFQSEMLGAHYQR